MNTLQKIFQCAYGVMNIKMNLFGYPISMWNIFMYFIILGILCTLVYKILS